MLEAEENSEIGIEREMVVLEVDQLEAGEGGDPQVSVGSPQDIFETEDFQVGPSIYYDSSIDEMVVDYSRVSFQTISDAMVRIVNGRLESVEWEADEFSRF